MIRRRGTEIIQFYVEDTRTFAASEVFPTESLFIRNNDYLDKRNCRIFGKLKNCLIRHGQLKKFCVKDT